MTAPDLPMIASRLQPHRLAVLGGFNPASDEPGLPRGTATLLMIGPADAGYWPHLTATPEWLDGRPDPVDRWSRRVIGRLACDLGAKARFPFGGPPHHPFYQWALRSGRCWPSPVKLLVHDTQGLWVSFRGALALPWHITMAPGRHPCRDCPQPCLTACPVAALGAEGYVLPRCHDHLDRPEGAVCLSGGCRTRAACPVSAGHARMEEHSAYHMRQFHR